jgi:hypothetical protein
VFFLKSCYQQAMAAWPGGAWRNATIAVRLFFFERAGLFFFNSSHLKDISREIEAIVKISIFFEDIFRESEAFFKVM